MTISKFRWIGLMVVMTWALLAAPKIASCATFVNFTVPAAKGGATPTGINRAGTVVGYYSSSKGFDSFIWQTNGIVTTIHVPGVNRNFAQSINASGWVVGYDQQSVGSLTHGFLRNPQYTTIDAPWAGTKNVDGTFPSSINDAGEIAGTYLDSNEVLHGFIRDASGNYTSFDISQGTIQTAFLSQDGQVAGSYTDRSLGMNHGYIRDTFGNITVFDPPNASGTYVSGMNATGEVAGVYYSSGTYHGFMRDASGNIIAFDVSGIVYAGLAGISDNGDVYGAYKNGGIFHGWKRSGATGLVTHFNDPAAANGTQPLCVSGNGKVAGYYFDSQKNTLDFQMHN